MDIKLIESYLLCRKGARLDYPFGPDVPVFKVGEKMFALITLRDGILSINLKCDPEEAVCLREMFPSVIPGYHMNKTHWNTVVLDGSIPHDLICKFIDDSHRLVVMAMKKSEQAKYL